MIDTDFSTSKRVALVILVIVGLYLAGMGVEYVAGRVRSQKKKT